jgi:hypothetical protein
VSPSYWRHVSLTLHWTESVKNFNRIWRQGSICNYCILQGPPIHFLNYREWKIIMTSHEPTVQYHFYLWEGKTKGWGSHPFLQTCRREALRRNIFYTFVSLPHLFNCIKQSTQHPLPCSCKTETHCRLPLICRSIQRDWESREMMRQRREASERDRERERA